MVKAYWKKLSSLFFGFIVAFLLFNHLGESIYDDPILFRLVFEDGNTINQCYQKQNCFLLLILVNLFDSFAKEI